jgi:hypothetical protein
MTGLLKDEFVILEGTATLYEMRAHYQSIGVGVRAARGVWLSNRHYLSTDTLDLMETGSFSLTNQRLIFVGLKRTMSLKLADIVSVDGGLDLAQISSTKRSKPFIFQGDLMTILRLWIPLLQQLRLTSPALPVWVGVQKLSSGPVLHTYPLAGSPYSTP